MKRIFNYFIKQKDYPENLIAKLRERKKFEMPEITDDIICGVEYAISTLQPVKASIVLGLYCDGNSYEELSQKFSVPTWKIENIEKNALLELGRCDRLMYIIYGIKGCTCRNIDYDASAAYEYGYDQGFVEGIKRAYSEDLLGNQYFLSIGINALGLNTRCYNALLRHKCLSIGDLISMDLGAIKNVRNLGASSAKTVAQTLEKCGIKNTAWSQFLN